MEYNMAERAGNRAPTEKWKLVENEQSERAPAENGT